MSKDVIKLDQLIRIAEDVLWETFEAMPDGRLLLQDRAQTLVPDEEDTSPLLWVFEMRVGLHFERPMQAIMSCGQFIRMRSTSVYENCILGKLDPEYPGGYVYINTQYPHNRSGIRRRRRCQRQLGGQRPHSMWVHNKVCRVCSGGQSTWTQYSSGGAQYSSGGGGSGGASTVWLGPGQTVTTANIFTHQQGTLSKLASALGVKI